MEIKKKNKYRSVVYDILDRKYTNLRSKFAEFFAVNKYQGILTSKYPSKILDTQTFKNIPFEQKEFLKENWQTYDLIKPLFENNEGEITCSDYRIYEIKSKLVQSEEEVYKKQTIKISQKQNIFFKECLNRNIYLRIIIVYFLPNGKFLSRVYQPNSLQLKISKPDERFYEKNEKLRKSKIGQMWEEIFPEADIFESFINFNHIVQINVSSDSINMYNTKRERSESKERPKKWTLKEMNDLKDEYERDISLEEMSKLHDRTQYAIISKLKSLGILK